MDFPGIHPAQARNARLTVLLGVVAFVVGAYFGLAALRFVGKSVPTTGIIVDRGGSTYTVQFEVEGRNVQFESDMPTTKGFARSQIQVGKEVEVRYVPSAPSEARVAGSKLWAFPLAMMFIGLVGIAGGLAKSRS
jgi:hypothetical protein